MSYPIVIDLIARGVAIILAIYFICILLFGDSQYKKHSFVLVVYSVIYYFMPSLDQSSLTYKTSYMQDVSVAMMIEGAGALAMVALLLFDKRAKYHALILAFAVGCHIMVYSYLQSISKVPQEEPLLLTVLFFSIYDELIILVGLMQMAVSYNGIITAYFNALSFLQSCISRSRVYFVHMRKSLSTREARENKT